MKPWIVWIMTASLGMEMWAAPTYPPARRLDLVEKIHGVSVADPYRWLEDLDSPETRAWVGAQNRYADAYFEATPGRRWILAKLEQLWKYDKFELPRKVGGKLFYTRKTGLENQGVLFCKDDLPGAEPVVLLDPNRLSADGTVALSDWEVSLDGRHLAYGLAEAGSDWMEWRVREVETGRDLPDRIRWVKFSSPAWAPDHRGFYYSRYAEPQAGEELQSINLNQKVYFHRLGDAQDKDELVYERPDHPKWGFGTFVSDDGRYLAMSVWESAGDKNAFFYRDLQGPGAEFVPLIPDFESSWHFLGNDGPRFYFLTTQEAPNGRIVARDTGRKTAEWEVIVPEGAQAIEGASLLQDQFLVTRLVDATSRVERYGLAGEKRGELSLPGVGSAWGFGGKRDERETFYVFTSYLDAGSVYRYDLETGRTTVFAKPETAFDASRYETRQMFIPSKDGTRVPLFVTGRKGLERHGKNPVYLYGYGGFSISLTPAYSPGVATWLEMGGVYAVANLRGGGEYGRAWHEAGTKERKQNVFDDFQAAAEALISEGITSRERLAIGGGSNGGLLVGACVNQRPDLYRAAVAQVGVFDMLRFHQFTIGWAWASDFGDPDKAEDFPALYAYSPYHRTKEGTRYPATLIMTGDHDDRVFPAHSFKFGAALQHAQTGGHPVLVRIETRAGHGAGKPTAKVMDELADQWSFLARELGMELPGTAKGRDGQDGEDR